MKPECYLTKTINLEDALSDDDLNKLTDFIEDKIDEMLADASIPEQDIDNLNYIVEIGDLKITIKS